MSGTSSSGARPKPTELKRVAGNPGGRQLNDDEPEYAKGIPEMPKYLGRAGKRFWRMYSKMALDRGVMTEADGKMLECAARAADLIELLQKDIDKWGTLIEEPIVVKGEVVGHKLVANPAISKMTDAMKTMKSILVEFGFSPSSRSKIKVEKKREEDPMEKFLSRAPVVPKKDVN